MIKGKTIISLLLILVLCLGMFTTVHASEIDETRQKAKELQEKKEAAEAEKDSLAKQLEELVKEMEDIQSQIAEKETELRKKEEELAEAQVQENQQYESMKKRIKYMYENGNAQFIEILCSSKSIGEFLNNAEYISTISEYDRKQLVEYQKIREQVEEQQKVLEEEYKKLETLQNELIKKQENVQSLMSSKESEISSLENELSETNEKLKELEAAAAEALRKQQEAAAGGGSAGASVISGNGMFTHPCPGLTRISSPFGYREAPMAGAGNNHKGIDFAAPTGTPIYAATDGTVVIARYSATAGNWIVIDHGNGIQTQYMHCSALYVSAGESVSKGQNIGAVGTTGNSTGPHLHFQVMVNGTPVNPLSYL